MHGGRYPNMPFNQQMSFPSELTLRTTADGPRLFRNPVREIDSLHAAEHRWSGESLKPGGDLILSDVRGDLLDIRAEIDIGDADQVTLLVGGEPISYDAKRKMLFARGEAPLQPADDRTLQLRILVDRTSIETFANDGRVSLTGCFLPKGDQPRLVLRASGGTARIRSLVVYELNSAWP